MFECMTSPEKLKAEFDGKKYVKLLILYIHSNNLVKKLIKMTVSVTKNREILPNIEPNVTNFEVWYTNIKLPKIEITNIDVYQYQGIPVLKSYTDV